METRKILQVDTPSETSRAAVPDEALLRRVQQENQRQIFGKLLHDLRNPIHSLRITMELFGRLARREGDVEALIARAAAYIGPAQTALDNLLINTERLGHYLGTPIAPVVAPLPVKAWLEEIALLLRASKRAMQVTVCVEADPAVHVLADRPRLSHAALQCVLGNDAPQAALRARAESDAVVHIDVSFAGNDAAPPRRTDSLRFTAQELRVLIENAGGTLAAAEDGSVSLTFRRSSG